MHIQRTHSGNDDFKKLVNALDDYLAVVNGESDEFYAQFNHIELINHAVVAYGDSDSAIGIGAMKPFDKQSMEVKRMFVLEIERGRGVAVAILGELEKWAKELGYSRCVLETGSLMKDAVRLYEKCGFQKIPNYGQYEGVDDSVCFEKQLTS